MLLREVVSNFQESGDRSKNSAFFKFPPKDPFGELFSKMTFKSSSESLFWQKIRKFEIEILSLAREKRARQIKIYNVHFHGVRSFSLRTPPVNHTLLGQNSTRLVSTSVSINLNISILTLKLLYLYC